LLANRLNRLDLVRGLDPQTYAPHVSGLSVRAMARDGLGLHVGAGDGESNLDYQLGNLTGSRLDTT
jgi:hypothetical protein